MCIEPVDLRKGFEGLSYMNDNLFPEKLLTGAYFVFLNKPRTSMKVLYWDYLKNYTKHPFAGIDNNPSQRALKINPHEYFEDVIRRIQSHSFSKLDELLPQNWKKL